MVGENKPRIAFFCASFLEPEMWHIYRQIRTLRSFDPLVIAQKRKNTETFPFDAIYMVPRGAFRFLGRFRENATGTPWQLGARETASIVSILQREQARILHVFFGNVAIHLLPLLRRCPVPFIVSFHGADVAGGPMTAGTRKALKEVFTLAALVGCRSEALGRDLAAIGCPERKIRIFRTVIPQSDYAPRSLPGDGKIRFIQACRLIEKKGIDLSLHAFAEFSKICPHAEFAIAGEGPDRESLRHLAEKLGIAAKVQWPGFLSQSELDQQFRQSHIFIHPSRTTKSGDREGIPNSMLEAMAAGLPVIVTGHGGIPEAVTNGREGILVPENDTSGLLSAMKSLTTNPDQYAQMSRAAYDRIRNEFSSAAQTSRLEDNYRELLI